jgi:hypothetical protein
LRTAAKNAWLAFSVNSWQIEQQRQTQAPRHGFEHQRRQQGGAGPGAAAGGDAVRV